MPCVLRVFCAALCAALWLGADAPALLAFETTATYYHPSLHGGVMANGERYNRWDPEIAACNWFPLGTVLKVTRLGTENWIYVRVKDRGSRALTLDLSEAAYQHLGRLGEGRIPISIEVVPLDSLATPTAAQPTDDVALPRDGMKPLDEDELVPLDENELDPAETAPVPVPLLGMLSVGALG